MATAGKEIGWRFGASMVEGFDFDGALDCALQSVGPSVTILEHPEDPVFVIVGSELLATIEPVATDVFATRIYRHHHPDGTIPKVLHTVLSFAREGYLNVYPNTGET